MFIVICEERVVLATEKLEGQIMALHNKARIGYRRVLSASCLIACVIATAGCSEDEGTNGEEGKKGATGTTGSTGPVGATGATGQTGASGFDGATGPVGATGAAGPQGLTGPVGATGVSGATGPSGAPGATGIAGPSGATGPGGAAALINTNAEPKGTNCPIGGLRVETGVDANANAVLDSTEVDPAKTKYLCSVAPPGANSTGMKVTVVSVSPAGTTPIALRFTLKDDKGFPIDIVGNYSLNTPIQPRFALAYYTQERVSTSDPNSALAVTPLRVYTKSGKTTALSPTAFNPQSSPPQGSLVENGYGAGDYTYTFPSEATATASTSGISAVAYDPAQLASTHMVWIQASRQTDLVNTTSPKTLYVANQDYYFVPDGTGTPLPARVIASQSGCDSCHSGFKAEGSSVNVFHSGGRVAAAFCNVCHNPERKNSDGTAKVWADSAAFVHRIHFGKELAVANQFHELAATYPQDIRNCVKCHNNDDGKTPAFNQYQTNPTIAACGSCHDGVDFVGAGVKCITQTTHGIKVACAHTGGPRADGSCATCHGPADVMATHVPVVGPDPKSCLATANATGCSNNTHGSYVAAAEYVPAGAAVISYDVKNVEAVSDGAVLRPRITFKLRKRVGTAAPVDVAFNAYVAAVTTELMTGFVGSPSVYFAWSVPQDGIEAPADFNASASGYIKNIWNGSAIDTGAGSLTGPDATGYYTITLTGVQIPAAAKMLTGGVGYSYNLSSSPPLVQTDLPAYPYNTDGTKQGGLSVPADNVWKVADTYTGRRAIVENSRCNACHGALGVAPSFHAGQRNDAPTCGFCHTPNRTSNGWSAGSKYFVHAIHATRMRTTPFNWHMSAAVAGNHWEAEFPSPLNDCESCHAPKTYDFSLVTANLASNLDSIPNQLLTTVGQDSVSRGVTSTYTTQTDRSYFFAPYVDSTNGTSYGVGFSFNASTNVTAPAASTTLVISQITTVCASCHDSSSALAHMRQNGGQFYDRRDAALASFGESCLTCHGPGKDVAIDKVHQ